MLELRPVYLASHSLRCPPFTTAEPDMASHLFRSAGQKLPRWAAYTGISILDDKTRDANIKRSKPTRAKRPPNWCLLIKAGETALEILPAAQEKQAGAVVLGTHGGGALRHMLLAAPVKRWCRMPTSR